MQIAITNSAMNDLTTPKSLNISTFEKDKNIQIMKYIFFSVCFYLLSMLSCLSQTYNIKKARFGEKTFKQLCYRHC